MKRGGLRAVLFDLDGTLVDSAPDLGGAANEMRLRRGLSALPLCSYRAHCGSGARGMLAVAFGLSGEHPDYEPHRQEFLSAYAARLLSGTRSFDGVESTLGVLARAGLRWGIVTNKTLGLAHPLCEGLGLRPDVLIGGDCAPHRKPHPAPLLEAAARLGIAPSDCIYVGDDPRDVTAGKAAGMLTAAAAWGYLGPDRPIATWGADHSLNHLGELLKLLGLP
jgi:phosphoglycolate phosphatase